MNQILVLLFVLIIGSVVASEEKRILQDSNSTAHRRLGSFQKIYKWSTIFDEDLGASVAVSRDGRTIAFGSPKYNGGAGGWYEQGRLQVFRDFCPILDLPGSGFRQKLGTAVAMSKDGRVFAVGAENGRFVDIYEMGKNPSKWFHRKRIEELTSKDWTGKYQQTIDVQGIRDNWVHEYYIAIGSPLYDGGKGAVRVFKLSKRGKVTRHGNVVTLKTSESSPRFGIAVSISASGGFLKASSYLTRAYGEVAIYELRSKTWKEVDRIKDPFPTKWERFNDFMYWPKKRYVTSIGDGFGCSLSASGDWLAVGIKGKDHRWWTLVDGAWNHLLYEDKGRAMVWEGVAGGRTHEFTFTGLNRQDYCGAVVALSDDHRNVAVTQPGYSRRQKYKCGRISIFDLLYKGRPAVHIEGGESDRIGDVAAFSGDLTTIVLGSLRRKERSNRMRPGWKYLPNRKVVEVYSTKPRGPVSCDPCKKRKVGPKRRCGKVVLSCRKRNKRCSKWNPCCKGLKCRGIIGRRRCK